MSDVDPEVKAKIRDILEDHKGEANAISAREISNRLDISDPGSFPSTRAIIRELVKEDNVPIGANHSGYYLIETREELEEYLARLRRRINGIEERRVRVTDAYEETKGETVEEFEMAFEEESFI